MICQRSRGRVLQAAACPALTGKGNLASIAAARVALQDCVSDSCYCTEYPACAVKSADVFSGFDLQHHNRQGTGSGGVEGAASSS